MSRGPVKAAAPMSEKRARTREKLLAATLEMMGKGGLYGVSLDAIAKSVGVTKGAIYDNFENKDALIVAALASVPGEAMDPFTWPQGKSGTVKQRLRRLGEAVLAGPGMDPRRAVGRVEFQLYAMTHPEMRSRLMEIGSLGPTRTETQVLGLFDAAELPMGPRAFAWLIQSLVQGLLTSRTLAPAPPDDAVVLELFEGLAG